MRDRNRKPQSQTNKLVEVFGPTDVDLADTFTTSEIADAYQISRSAAATWVKKAIRAGQVKHAGRAPRTAMNGCVYPIDVYRLISKGG